MQIPDFINQLTFKIIGICMETHRTLGPGFPEEYYQKALEYEFTKNNINFKPQEPLIVNYKEIQVGVNFLDFLIEDILILEIKSVHVLNNVHRFQVIKYLAASGYKIALLVNFGQESLKYERILPPKKIQNKKIENNPDYLEKYHQHK